MTNQEKFEEVFGEKIFKDPSVEDNVHTSYFVIRDQKDSGYEIGFGYEIADYWLDEEYKKRRTKHKEGA